MKKEDFQVKSIGEIRNDQEGFYVQIFPPFVDAMLGLKGFTHLYVLWWAHEMDQDETRAILKVEKPYAKGPDHLGIFSTRSPLRPNPIALTQVMVLDIDQEKGIIRIPYIDAMDRTPVVDIKPYYGMDRIESAKVPEWCSHWPSSYEKTADFDWAGEFENAQ